MEITKILVVDDEEVIRFTVKSILRKFYYQVFEASNGEEGLQRANECRPHLIVLDVMMPSMDGWTFLRHFRSTPQFVFVPVVFLTSLDSIRDRAQMFRLGADDFMLKPILPEELIFRINKALQYSKRIQAEFLHNQFSPEGSNFHGILDELGIASVLSIIELDRKSGILTLNRLDEQKVEEKAKVFLRQGRVVATEFQGRRDIHNRDVIYYLLSWKTGRFSFMKGDVQLEDQIQKTLTSLLLEGARRIDEHSRL